MKDAIEYQLESLDEMGDLDEQSKDMFAKTLMENDQTNYKEFFQKLSQSITDQPTVEAKLAFIESLWKNDEFLINREENILTFLFYYKIAAFIEEDKLLDNLHDFIRENIEERVSVKQLLEKITNKYKISPNKAQEIASNIHKAEFIKFAYEFLQKKVEVSKVKILDKYQQILYELSFMDNYEGMIQFELQKHILVQFEKKHLLNDQRGEKYRFGLMPMGELKRLFDNEKRSNDQIQKYFQKMESSEDKLTNLFGIKIEINCLNTYAIKRYVELSKENFKGKKKDIIILIGTTGAGKTTIILKLLGYNLKESRVSGIKTLIPQNLKEIHNKFQSSPQSSSMTRYMSLAQIPKQNFSNQLSDKVIYICDSPGFQDSEGAEVDIANCIGMIEALKKCNTVKVALVISGRRIGDKFEGIKAIGKIVSNLFVSYAQIKNNVSFIFNKFDNEDQFNRLLPGINSVYQKSSASEKGDEGYTQFLNHLKEHLTDKKQIIRFNHKTANVPELLNMLKVNPIKDPRKSFKQSLSENSKLKLKSKTSTLVRQIKQKLNHKNMKEVMYLLNELHTLKGLYHNQDIQHQYQNVCQYIKTQADNIVKSFERKLQEIVDNDANSSTTSELKKIEDEISSYQGLINSHLLTGIKTKDDIKIVVQQRKDQMMNNIRALGYSSEKLAETKRIIKNSISFFNNFEPTMVNDIHDIVCSKYQQKKAEILSSLNEDNFNQLQKQADIIKNIVEVTNYINELKKKKNPEEKQTNKINIEDIQGLIEDKLNFIAGKPLLIINNLKKSSSKSPIDESNLKVIKDTLSIFGSLQSKGRLLGLVTPKDFKDQIVTKIVEYIQSIIEESKKILEDNISKQIDQRSSQIVKANKLNTLTLISIPIIKESIGSEAESLWKNLDSFIKSQQRLLNQLLTDLNEKNQINRKSLKNLKAMINRVIKLSEGDDCKQAIQNLKNQIENSLCVYVTETLKPIIDKVNPTIKISKNLGRQQLTKILTKFTELEALNLVKPIEKAKIGELQDALKSQIRSEQYSEDKVQFQGLVNELFDKMIKKLLNPFLQITAQCTKIEKSNIALSPPSSFLNKFSLFIKYKECLQQFNVLQNDTFKTAIQDEEVKCDYMRCIVAMIQIMNEDLSTLTDKEKKVLFHELEVGKKNNLKKYLMFFNKIDADKDLQQLFILNGLQYAQTRDQIIESIRQSYQQISKQLETKQVNQAKILLKFETLKNQTEEMKIFDYFQWNEDAKQQKFGMLYNKILQILQKLQGKQHETISRLFLEDNFNIQKIQLQYTKKLENESQNESKKLTLEDNIKNYIAKQKKQLAQLKKKLQIQSLDSFQSSPTFKSYIVILDKFYKLYLQLQKFLDVNFMKDNLDDSWFKKELKDIQWENIFEGTYDKVKEIITDFGYQKKDKEFQKINGYIRKMESIIKVIFKNEYEMLYQQKENDAKSQEMGQDDRCKFSDKLKFEMDKYKKLFNNSIGPKKLGGQNKQQNIGYQALLKSYGKMDAEGKEIIESKVESHLTQLFHNMEMDFKNPEKSTIAIQQVKKQIEKLPRPLAKNYTEKFQQKYKSLKEEQEEDAKKFREELQQQSNSFAALIHKFEQQNKNQFLEKQCLGVIKNKLKVIKDQIVKGYKKGKINETIKSYTKQFRMDEEQSQKIVSIPKIKEIFQNQEKAIIGSIIYFLKNQINELNSSFSKSDENSLKFYQQSNNIIESYITLIEQEYKGVCPGQYKKLEAIYQDFINSNMDKFTTITEQKIQIPRYFIQNGKSNLEKYLIQLFMMKNFFSRFLELMKSKKFTEISSNNAHFIQAISQKIKNTTSNNVNLLQFKEYFKNLNRSITEKQFYDDFLKIMNEASLEVEFQNNLHSPLLKLREYEEIYNKYLSNSIEEQIKSDVLASQLRDRWMEAVKQCISELNLSTTVIQRQISPKINTIYTLSKIIIRKKWTFLDENQTSKDLLEKNIDQKYTFLLQQFKQHEAEIYKFDKIKKQIFQDLNDKKEEIKEQSYKLDQKYGQLKENLIKERDSLQEQQLIQKKQMEIHNLELRKKEQVQKMNEDAFKTYTEQKQKCEKEYKLYCTEACKSYIIYKKINVCIMWRQAQYSIQLNKSLFQLGKRSKQFINALYANLVIQQPYGSMIITQSDVFKNQVAKDFLDKTSKQDIKYVLNNCPQFKNNKALKDDIEDWYQSYQEQYKMVIEQFKKNPMLEQIQMASKYIRDFKDKIEKNIKTDIQTPRLIARIFSLWSMMRVDMNDIQNLKINFEPHPAQIVAIFLLIGFSCDIKNTLVQLLTGQGKSIVLAGLCSYLALKGYQPYCACYSEYLSARDEQQFKDLFQKIGINDKIKYGTFNVHCQSIINQACPPGEKQPKKSRNFRDQVKLVLESNKQEQSSLEYFCSIFDQENSKSSKKILIIDEADVFFNENFFGRLYCPSISLNSDQVKHLLETIWKITKESRENKDIRKVTKKQIIALPQFTALESKYPYFKQILTNQVSGLIQAVYNYEHFYVIHQQTLKYKDNDSITDKISYGFKTVFANCFQSQKKTISYSSYKSSLKIVLSIAPFSYSQLPKFFQNILGVSGTINHMSKYKKSVLKRNYNINDTYAIPSIYGASQRTIDQFTIVTNEEFYDEIVKKAKKISETKRPVAIFFRTIKDVANFYKSKQFEELRDKTSILSQQTENQCRDSFIKRVGQRQKITILTESFSRGTDFKIFDKKIAQDGGLHVIQAYISSDLSQYIQMKGRTARQGSKGSFEMIVRQSQLETLAITNKNSSDLEKEIMNGWIVKDQKEGQLLKNRYYEAVNHHEKTKELFEKKPTKEELVNFIFRLNSFTQTTDNNIKTLIAVDGTCSMKLTFQKILGILEDCFFRTEATLKKKEVSGSFENQIVVYRNYDSDCQKILQYSGFQSRPQKLKQFVQKVKVSGGWGNQAVEVALRYANNLQELDQIILILDAPANTKNDVTYKRSKQFGEKYWIDNGFPQITFDTEVQTLKEKNVKIHTFYLGNNKQLKAFCSSISASTEGECQQFKINNKDASQLLNDFLVTNILKLIGGEKGEELVLAYREDFALRT